MKGKAKVGSIREKQGFFARLKQDIQRHPYIYLLALPVILFYIAFSYVPMFGLVIAFEDYVPIKGVFASKWIGLANFKTFLSDPYFFRILKNTLLISVYDIIFGFTTPVIFAILLNEVRKNTFKRCVQTITYLPHFISTMVICGMIVTFVGRNGFINDIIAFFGGERTNLLSRPEMFRTIYVSSGIWQTMGWNSIIYLAALTSIDSQLYESAAIDGAGAFGKIWHVSLPGIIPTITIMFILRLGSLLSVGYEKIILLYSEATYETADVISSYVYRRGIINTDFSYSAAVGLLNSVVNFIIVVTANKLSKSIGETSLW